jgi:hypothetical protein
MKLRLLLVALAFLGGCASAGSVAASATDADLVASTKAVSLPPQTLEPGGCALFLWTRDDPRHFVLFFPAGGLEAEAILNGRQQTLSVESQDGDVFGQFMTRMSMRDADGEHVSLTLAPGDEIEGGRKVPLARMISKDAEGWEIITPLTGLTACQAE